MLSIIHFTSFLISVTRKEHIPLEVNIKRLVYSTPFDISTYRDDITSSLDGSRSFLSGGNNQTAVSSYVLY